MTCHTCRMKRIQSNSQWLRFAFGERTHVGVREARLSFGVVARVKGEEKVAQPRIEWRDYDSTGFIHQTHCDIQVARL